MPKVKVIKNEDSLPEGYVLAKRIDYTNYTTDSLRNAIEENCITNGQPLVISNINQIEGWNDKLFSLEQLKKYRGDSGNLIFNFLFL
jgi:hypothetical protein